MSGRSEGGRCTSVEHGGLVRVRPVAGSHEFRKQTIPQCPGTVPSLSEASILPAEMCAVTGERELGWVTEPVVSVGVSPKKS